MTRRSKSMLFLIEQLIVIAVFAICAVACISILTAAYLDANDSRAISRAIVMAESGAEVFKATGGDFAVIADMLGGRADVAGADVIVYYNSAWQAGEADGASYVLSLVTVAPEYDAAEYRHDISLITGRLTVERITGEELIALTLATRGR